MHYNTPVSTTINYVLCRSGLTMLGPLQWARRYRCIQLLHNRANETLMYPLATLKCLCLLASIRCLYGVVRMNGYMRLLNGTRAVCYVGFLIVFFRSLGQVFDLSEQVLAQRRRSRGDKWLKRFHRSCWPLKFEIGGLYFADPPMSLTMGSFVVQNVVNMLMLSG